MKKQSIDIDRIAALSNLELSGEGRASLERDCASIVEFVGKLQRVDTSETDVTNQVTDLENVFRADDVVPFPHHRAIVEGSGRRHENLFRVPGVFDEGAPHDA